MKHQSQLRPPHRNPERKKRKRRGEPDQERSEAGQRGSEHAEHSRSDPPVPRSQNPLRTSESRQRRRRSHLRTRNGAKQRAHLLDPRRSRRSSAQHHDRHPQKLLRNRREVWHARQSGKRRQYRRLPESSKLNAGSGPRVVSTVVIETGLAPSQTAEQYRGHPETYDGAPSADGAPGVLARPRCCRTAKLTSRHRSIVKGGGRQRLTPPENVAVVKLAE